MKSIITAMGNPTLNNELKNVIRFDDLNTFYNNYKKIKIRIE